MTTKRRKKMTSPKRAPVRVASKASTRLSPSYRAYAFRKPELAEGSRGAVESRKTALVFDVTQKRDAIRRVRRSVLALGAGARGDVYAGDALIYQCHVVGGSGKPLALRVDEL